MAATALTGSPPSQPSLTHPPPPPRKLTTVKALSESPGLSSIPSIYTFLKQPYHEPVSDTEEPIPTIDFSLLTSSLPDERGYSLVTSHGVPERMMKAIIEACREFLELPEEEKRGISGKHVLDPIRFGTSFNESVDEILCWRDYVKIFQHPEFHSPNKPPSFSKRVRLVAREIIRGISESLGLEKDYIYETLNPENGLQLIAANLYPPCPQPELAMGLPPHSDHGLLTLLIQNQIGGLQVQHKGKWVNIDPIPNSFLANIGDHIEILSNGKYKSVLHRAVVNNRDVRISIAVPHGPALDAIFSPDSKLVENVGNPPAYGAMKYKEYLEFQQGTMLNGKSFLERIRNRV
ncbi:2-oxoglutarate-dependent dioxygenase 19 isoform X2 [Gossypium hirsutum]|uniref:2-oxoglutarate-dependent dioxygenase 19 isoform X2 n=1 Tax=Gossypium hirsutum TaxID=3635 RepID=A0ABM2ZD85_GOSHI|nr:2-oxoglutarate-dependent dioxygenase 19 isoform X2 [Gossypium hirsutum]